MPPRRWAVPYREHLKICLSCEGVTDTSAPRCGHCGAWLLPTDAVHYPVRRGEIDAGNPLLGTVVDGKYRLQSVLGRGGLGTVFRAQHIGSLMSVAVKLLHPRFAERPEYRRALLPEARRAATVTHERCARLLDVGEADEGVAYLAMELVDGVTLEQLVRKEPLPPSHAVDVLAQVAEALVAIHAAGLVHCDLSPRNVMVAVRGGVLHAKVLDFGIARSVTMAGTNPAPNEFAGFVNPAFAAPELLAGQDVSPRADLFSFGMLAWVLLTGELPVDDTDPRRAAAAVVAGELQPWTPIPGVPRRLAQLIQRCLAHDPEARPASAAVVRRELALVRGARRPALARAAIAAAALAVIALLAVAGDPGTPFLRPVSGASVVFAEGPLPAGEPAQDLPSTRLATLGFHYGGFGASRLRADLARGGIVLLRTPLQPDVNPVEGTLRLSTAQPEWRVVVDAALQASAEGPVDLTFVVPGTAPLGTARLRLDDDAPSVTFGIEDGTPALTSRTRMRYEVQDHVGIDTASVRVVFANGLDAVQPLPVAGREFELGRALASAVPRVDALGGGEVFVVARDRAGNEQRSAPFVFAAADLAAPHVEEVTGQLGEPFIAVGSRQVPMRVRLSAVEEGCTLVVRTSHDHEAPPEPLAAQGVQTVLVELGDVPGGRSTWQFVVTDRAGNRTAPDLPVDVRDASVRLELKGDGHTARWLGSELVLADTGAAVAATIGGAWSLAGARIDPSVLASAPGDTSVGLVRTDTGVELRFGALLPGVHTLQLDLRQGDADQGLSREYAVSVRVLPPAIEVRVPAGRPRYLAGLLQAGVLMRGENGLVEGNGWRLDPALRPYVRGHAWIGGDAAVPLRLAEANASGAPLLPAFVPVPGRNVLAVELTDVLERPIRVVTGDDAQPGATEGRHPIADFWWSDAGPEVVGEETLVEFGQPARFQLRFPLPFLPAEAPEIRLGIAQGEVPAARVTALERNASLVTFDVPFAIWSVAAQLADKTRNDYAAQLDKAIDVYVATPAVDAGNRPKLTLRVRTARSTLRPVVLSELSEQRELPPAIGAIRLLPVLAPLGEFAEPVPANAPPRASFRPQVATSVRNAVDLLLQDREVTCGQARALAEAAATLPLADRHRCVHFEDPAGVSRISAAKLLPASAANAPDDASLTGVDFFQAYTLTRVLGVVVAGDAAAFRLPLGCELEIAAFAGATVPACSGAVAHGGTIRIEQFLAAGAAIASGKPPSVALCIDVGDVVPAAFGAEFVGLDFGVREWVFDLPHIPGAEMLMKEWVGDFTNHLDRVEKMARGVAEPMPDPVGPLRHLGVVRGLPFGQRSGLIGADGTPLRVETLTTLPASVPGVLRTEQLRRDGVDLLAASADPRLLSTGFRVASDPRRLVVPAGGQR